MSRLDPAREWAGAEALGASDGAGWPPLPQVHDRQALAALRKQERAIAIRFQTSVTWPYTAAAIVCLAAWISFFPLAIMGILPLWLGCLLTSVFVAGGYVVAHEAMHSNLGRPGTPRRFWNELTGQIATIPLMLPFSMLKTMHLLHHKHTNHPDKDPDAIHAAPNLALAIIRSWRNRQPGPNGTAARWRRHCAELGTPEARRAVAETMLFQLAGMAFLFAMAWSGHAIEVAMLWWLPRHIGLTYIHAVLSWAPHYPHGSTARYENTRVFRHPLGEVLSFGIGYHLIHHLYPHIPVHATGAAYHEMKPLLEQRGVDCSAA